DAWGSSPVIGGRRRIPFLEREGGDWGEPGDDATAIRELERLRESGANFMVFVQPALWWLDYYAGLHHHLRSNFRCALANDTLVVFDLRADHRSQESGVRRQKRKSVREVNQPLARPSFLTPDS